MIKLNHKNETVKGMAKQLIDDSINDYQVVKYSEQQPDLMEVMFVIESEGYRIKYVQNFAEDTVELLEVWQLDDCENPIFEV